MGGKKEIYQYIRFFHGALQLTKICPRLSELTCLHTNQQWQKHNLLGKSNKHLGSRVSSFKSKLYTLYPVFHGISSHTIMQKESG